MTDSAVAGLSLIMETNEEVDRAADLLRAVGLEVAGEDGFVEVVGSSIRLSVMRGAMVEVPRHGGLLVQIAVPDVDSATEAARNAGGIVASEPAKTDWGGYSAFVQSPQGFTLELQAAG